MWRVVRTDLSLLFDEPHCTRVSKHTCLPKKDDHCVQKARLAQLLLAHSYLFGEQGATVYQLRIQQQQQQHKFMLRKSTFWPSAAAARRSELPSARATACLRRVRRKRQGALHSVQWSRCVLSTSNTLHILPCRCAHMTPLMAPIMASLLSAVAHMCDICLDARRRQATDAQHCQDSLCNAVVLCCYLCSCLTAMQLLWLASALHLQDMRYA